MSNKGDKIKYELKDGTEGKKKKREEAPQPVFKTEDMLKQEARDKLEEQARLEAEKPPMTERQKKVDNFFFHYKYHTIFSIIGAVLIAFFIKDTLFRVKPDVTVIIATSRFITQVESDALKDALERNMEDTNGDGRVLLNMDTIYLPIASMYKAAGLTGAGGGSAEGGAPGEDAGGDVAGENADGDNAGESADDFLNMTSMEDAEMIQASSMKLMAVIAAWSDPMFLTDEALYDYLLRMSGPSDIDLADPAEPSEPAAPPPENTMFETLGNIPAAFGHMRDQLAIKDTALAAEPGLEYLGELAFSVRPLQDSKPKNVAYQEYCISLLETLADMR